MLGRTPSESRKIVGWGILAIMVWSIVWGNSPGIPVLVGPWAWSGQKERGQELFIHEWQPNDPLAGGDGLGPVFNAKSCAACHFQGGAGGAGENQGDVQVFQVR